MCSVCGEGGFVFCFGGSERVGGYDWIFDLGNARRDGSHVEVLLEMCGGMMSWVDVSMWL